jgi:hypothetical protein
MERRWYATGGGGRGFRILCRGSCGLARLKNEEAGVCGSDVLVVVNGVEEVFPMV